MTREELYDLYTIEDEREREAKGDKYLTRDEKLQRDYDDRVQESERLNAEMRTKDEEIARLSKDIDVYKDRVAKLVNATPMDKQRAHHEEDLKTLENHFYGRTGD